MFFKLFAYFRIKKGKEEKERIDERFGIANNIALERLDEYKNQCNKNGVEPKTIWIHAVSVGESLSVLEFVNKLSYKNYFIVFTTTTTTSANMIKKKLPTNSIHQYNPYQSKKYVKQFLETWKPKMVFFTESEIFPNIINILYKMHIPLYLLNARMSGRSFKRWMIFKFYIKKLLLKYEYIFPLSENELKKFEVLSDKLANLKCFGNLKFDTAIENKKNIEFEFKKDNPDVAKCKLLSQSCNSRKIIVFGSIHKEEFFHLIWQYSLILKKISCIGVFVPRHLEDCELLEKNAIEADFIPSYWNDFCGGDFGNFIIVNEMNVLQKLYKICDTAVICGSFVDGIGGHNPIESVVFKKPTFIGKYCCKSQDLVDQLLADGIVIQTQNLCSGITNFFANSNSLPNLQANVDSFFQKHANVADKIIEEIGL